MMRHLCFFLRCGSCCHLVHVDYQNASMLKVLVCSNLEICVKHDSFRVAATFRRIFFVICFS